MVSTAAELTDVTCCIVGGGGVFVFVFLKRPNTVFPKLHIELFENL